MRDEASGGRRERRSEEEEKGRSVGGREIGREVNFKGGTSTLSRTLASIHYTAVIFDVALYQILSGS